MSNNYTPPPNTEIPFRFSSQGYTSPSSSSIEFKFSPSFRSGDLQSAINIMQLYRESTYTYVKSCPKYVIGYDGGVPQIIDGRCVFGGIRDLGAIISGSYKESPNSFLQASINGVKFSSFSDLLSNCSTDTPRNISSFIKTHLPIDISAEIYVMKLSSYGDLYSDIDIHYPSDIYGYIDVHLPKDISAIIKSWSQSLSYIRSSIRPFYREYLSYVYSNVETHQPDNLTSSLELHQPMDIRSYIDCHIHGEIKSSIRSWYVESESFLLSSTFGFEQGNLLSSLGGSLPRNLITYVKGYVSGANENLVSYIRSFVESPYLGSSIFYHQPENIYSIIRGFVKESYNNVGAIVKSFETIDMYAVVDLHTYESISLSIRPWYIGVTENINSSIRVWSTDYISSNIDSHIWGNLIAIVLPHPPPPLPAIIKGWFRGEDFDLYSNIYGWGQGNLSSISGGHLHGNLNMLMKGVVLGVIKELPTNIYGWQDLNLSSYIGTHKYSNFGILLKGVVLGVTKNIKGLIYGWQEGDLGVITKGGHLPSNMVGYIRIYQSVFENLNALTYGWEVGNISSVVGTHFPLNLSTSIRSWYREIIGNLTTIVRGWQELDIYAKIGTHKPENLGVILKALGRVNKNIKGSIYGWEEAYLGLKLGGTHDPVSILADIFVRQRSSILLDVFIHSWHSSDLNSFLRIVFFENVVANIYPIPPSNLNAYLKVRQSVVLNAYTRGWVSSDLSAVIDQVYYNNLKAVLKVSSDPFRNLKSMLHGIAQRDEILLSSIRSLMFRFIGATIRSTYLSSLYSYVFSIAPKDILARIHSWHTIDLIGIISGIEYPWNLKASIVGSGGFNSINAYIYSIKFGGVYKDLSCKVHSLEYRLLSSEVNVELAHILGAYINPFMVGSNLTANIRPKMIRLTTLVGVSTFRKQDLSAIINFPCFHTGYSSISATIYSKFKSELQGIIRALRFSYKQESIKSSVGYSDYMLVVDKFKLMINVYPSEVFTEDIHRLNISVIQGYSFLSAFIRCTLKSDSLASSIKGLAIPKFSFDRLFNNREQVVTTTYDGVFKSYEVVELSFYSAVKDYYYSSHGSFVWSEDRFKKWMLSIESYIPADTSLKLARRLHKFFILHDIKKFVSLDAAVRFAIDYVTEYPQSNIIASIVGSGYFDYLSGSIFPRSSKKSNNSISSEIKPIERVVVVKTSNSVVDL